MKFLKNKTLKEVKKDSIFKIAKLALDAKTNGFDVINATLGTLYDENQILAVHENFYKEFNQLDDRKKAAYAPGVDGGVMYASAVKNWVFQNHEFLKKSRVVATPGGSGALAVSFSELVKPNDFVIIPDIFWGPYEIIMDSNGGIPKKCACFENGCFSLEPIKAAMKEVAALQNNIIVVINDPCHNPTGYSMGIDKWKELVEFSNQIAQNGKTVTIINDIAYIDYSADFEHSRDYMEVFKEMNDDVAVIFAFSGSKSLTAYGMRIGAAIIYTNQNEDQDLIHMMFEKKARGTWSNANNGAINTIINVFNQPEDFIKNIKSASSMLAKRTAAFLESAHEVGLEYYPTKEGFFITIKGVLGRNEELYERLKQQHIYVVPLPKGIRIAICALPLEHCRVLPKRIQEVIEDMNNAK